MKFVKSSVQYMFKNFFRLIIFALPLSVFYVFLFTPMTVPNFLKDYKNMTVDSFSDILKGIFHYEPIKILYVALLLIFSVLIFSYLTSSIEYHLRTGKFSFLKGFILLKQYFFPTLVAFIILLLLNFLFLFIASSVSYFIHVASGNINGIIDIRGYYMVVFVHIASQIILILISVFLLACINSMVLNRTTFTQSLSFTSHSFEGMFLKFVTSFFMIFMSLIFVFLLGFNFEYLNYIYVVLYALAIMYIISVNIIAFFSINKLERKDLVKFPFNF